MLRNLQIRRNRLTSLFFLFFLIFFFLFCENLFLIKLNVLSISSRTHTILLCILITSSKAINMSFNLWQSLLFFNNTPVHSIMQYVFFPFGKILLLILDKWCLEIALLFWEKNNQENIDNKPYKKRDSKWSTRGKRKIKLN